jgi:type IV secretion system protein VirD4
VLRLGALVAGGLAAAHLGAVVAVARRPRGRAVSGAHGTAAWGTGEGLDGPTGVLLGRLDGRLLRFGADGHLLTVAPTRSGKGVSGVVPNLLDHPGAVVVTDPKGENYAVTARRRRALGQQVVALDPFDVAGGDGAFNPLGLLDAESIDAVDDAAMLADMLVLVEGPQEAAFWTEEARALLAGLILHVAANEPPELRTLARVRALLTLAPDDFAALLEAMQASPAARGLVARAAARVLQKAPKERSAVVSTAQSHTHFLDSARMERVLGRSTVDLADLKRGALSLYLVLPPERLDTYARWLRLMVACGVLAMTRAPGAPRARVLFLLDEFPHLGRMAPVERAVALVGSYGARFWIFVQDLAQLERAYGKGANSFLANADVLQAFGTNDLATSETLSKLTGDATVATASENRSAGISRGRGGSAQQGAAITHGETGRKLLLPDEVRRLPRDRQLLFVKGAAPILAAKLAYYADPEFAGLADPNPLHAPAPGGAQP